MNKEEFFNRLINKIDKEFGYDVANKLQLMFIKKEKQVEQLEKEIDRLNKEYERIYNENCKLRENHNINDITLLDENERLNNIINELEKELNKKIEAIKTIKDMLGEEAKIVNPHIELLETEYKYFLDKLKALKENNK